MKTLSVFSRIGNFRHNIPILYKSIAFTIAHFELINGLRVQYYLDKENAMVKVPSFESKIRGSDAYLAEHCTCMNSDHDVPGGACTC